MRRVLGGFALLSAAALVAISTACGDFDAAPSPDDGGLEAATPVVDAAIDVNVTPPSDAGPDVDVDADAGPLPCLSQHFEDGGDAGDCDPIVFVTPDKYRGDLGVDGGLGVETADAICASLGAPHVFKAWMSDHNHEAAGTRFTELGAGSHRAVYLSNGTLFATSYFDLVQQHQPSHQLNLTLKGGLVSDDEEVWTGTQLDGSQIADCNAWTDGTGLQTGASGRVGSLDYAWTRYQENAQCDQQKHLYCFEIVP